MAAPQHNLVPRFMKPTGRIRIHCSEKLRRDRFPKRCNDSLFAVTYMNPRYPAPYSRMFSLSPQYVTLMDAVNAVLDTQESLGGPGEGYEVVCAVSLPVQEKRRMMALRAEAMMSKLYRARPRPVSPVPK